mmetsp:Transcript_10478/g.24790  ORF Transcript_10478/g.24790 Transcript_10478/m.24790 type:complete len:218 (-) Transcript_10478:545-1198(-)
MILSTAEICSRVRPSFHMSSSPSLPELPRLIDSIARCSSFSLSSRMVSSFVSSIRCSRFSLSTSRSASASNPDILSSRLAFSSFRLTASWWDAFHSCSARRRDSWRAATSAFSDSSCSLSAAASSYPSGARRAGEGGAPEASEAALASALTRAACSLASSSCAARSAAWRASRSALRSIVSGESSVSPPSSWPSSEAGSFGDLCRSWDSACCSSESF